MKKVYNQIKNTENIKNEFTEPQIKTAMRDFTFKYTDIDQKQFDIDEKQWKVLKTLRKKIIILKPNKVQGEVLLKYKDYTNCVEIFQLVEISLNVSKETQQW